MINQSLGDYIEMLTPDTADRSWLSEEGRKLYVEYFH